MSSQSAKRPVVIVLLVLYLTLLVYTSYKLYKLWAGGHKRRSYLMGFCVGVELWAIFRSVYWVLLLTDQSKTSTIWSHLLFWLPQATQAGVFGLLTIFYLKLTHREVWRHKWKRPTFLTYTIVMSVLVILEILSAIFTSSNNDTPTQVNSIATGGLFLALGISYIYFGVKILELKASQYQRMFTLRPKTIAVTNFILSAIFISRAAFDIISGFGLFIISLPPTGAKNRTIVFATFSVWEILPILLLFVTIASKREGREPEQVKRPSFGVFGAIKQQELSSGATPAKGRSAADQSDTGSISGFTPLSTESPSWTHDLSALDAYHHDGDDDGNMSFRSGNAPSFLEEELYTALMQHQRIPEDGMLTDENGGP